MPHHRKFHDMRFRDIVRFIRKAHRGIIPEDPSIKIKSPWMHVQLSHDILHPPAVQDWDALEDFIQLLVAKSRIDGLLDTIGWNAADIQYIRAAIPLEFPKIYMDNPDFELWLATSYELAIKGLLNFFTSFIINPAQAVLELIKRQGGEFIRYLIQNIGNLLEEGNEE